MDESKTQALIAEWTRRGRAIEEFVTNRVSAEYVPITLFEHPLEDSKEAAQ